MGGNGTGSHLEADEADEADEAATDAWATRAPMPTARENLAAASECIAKVTVPRDAKHPAVDSGQNHDATVCGK